MTSPAQPELKPCPCCGSTKIHDGTRGMNVAAKRVKCLQCGLQAHSRDAWNRRATPSGPTQLLANDMENARDWSKDCEPNGWGWRPTMGRMADEIDRLTRGATPAGESVTGNVRLHDAAQVASEWLRWWLDRNECECEDVHTCGKAKRNAELRELEAALNATEPTDLDRAWAWFRESNVSLDDRGFEWRAYSAAGVYVAPTKDAAVLAAWRAATGEGQE